MATPLTDREIFNAYDEEGDALPVVNPDFSRRLEESHARCVASLIEGERVFRKQSDPADEIAWLAQARAAITAALEIK